MSIQKKVTQTLAEAFNLLAGATLSGVLASDAGKAAAIMAGFQSVVAALNDEDLVITESNPTADGEYSDETSSE